MLLLVKRKVHLQHREKGQNILSPVTLLNYLDILEKIPSQTLITASSGCYILAIEGSMFDELLIKDKDFVRQLSRQFAT